ncbi:MAG: methyltransferase domain-containing protein [Hyphomicrobiaceae bacterium]|nr:methyltransferase domain-containing protein [Hyphomicrobiaceae bacterium]MCC0010433.1 methyltransferase domain-containing protein [Hyphomicrobiaceae bacterium]
MTSLADKQTWSAEKYAANARFVADMAGEISSWLAPAPGMRILDVGCGDGALTRRIADTGANVVGIDSSPELLERARALGLDVREVSVTQMTFDNEFDAIFSNAVLHWVNEPDLAIARMRAALKSSGRLVAEFGGHGNIASIVTAMRAVARSHGVDESLASPWFYPTPDEYRAKLEPSGFKVERIGLFPRLTPLPTGMHGWLDTFRATFFAAFGDRAEEARRSVEDLLRPSLCDRAGNWTADYVRLRVEAVAV